MYFAEKVEYWLTSIASFSFEEQDGHIFFPPIMMVGSKLDQVDEVSFLIFEIFSDRSNILKKQ